MVLKEKNLSLYVADLFESYYEIVDKFNRDCRLDKQKIYMELIYGEENRLKNTI